KRLAEWRYIHPRPLHRIKVGVMGLGHLGSAVASALANLGFDVLGWDHEEKAIPGVKCFFGDARNDFLSQVEMLVNMLPLTPQTKGLIDETVFASLPKGAKFINA